MQTRTACPYWAFAFCILNFEFCITRCSSASRRRCGRRGQRPVAVVWRPVGHRQIPCWVEHRRIDAADLPFVDHEPFAEDVARRRRPGAAQEDGGRQHDARLLVDNRKATRGYEMDVEVRESG